MEKSTDAFTWTDKLECPSICNDSVKKILRAGLVGLLWDDLADVIYTAEEAITIRKNILLRHLKKGTSNKVIQCVKNISQLKSERNELKVEISKLEEEYEQQDFVVRQSAQKLRTISSKRSEVKARRDLLKMKYDQTATQLSDCNNMRLVSQHLMPSTCKDLDPKILMEMFETVTSLWTGANKREVWDTVSSNLGHIEVPTLWLYLYQNLTEDVDALMKSESMESLDTEEKAIKIGIAKAYGQHVLMVSKRLLHNAKVNNYQQNVLEFIEKIEADAKNSSNISEWLALVLEVSKLENEQTNLQEEVNEIHEELHKYNTIAFDLAELTTEMQNIDTEIVEYMQDIQRSLSLLKSVPMFLMKSKEKMVLELQNIATMRTEGYDSKWVNQDLSTELDIFRGIVDISTFRKIMLKGDIGIYRHTKCCFSEAPILITNSQVSNVMSYFPMIQTPIYSLVECYKNLISMFTYKRFDSLEIEEISQELQMPLSTHEEDNYNTVELLNLSKAVNTRTKAEIDEFKEILNAWIQQTVQKVMDIIEKTVDDASFPEWIERYDLLSYMLQNST